MKIDNYVSSAISSGNRAEEIGSANSGFAASKSAKSGNDDRLELSATSRVLQSASQGRASRLEQLSQLVRSGQYSVPAHLISQALVKETLGNGTTSW